MAEHPDIRERLTRLIGEHTYINNVLNKPAIASFLFANAENAARINSIVHPLVRQDFLQWAERQQAPLVAQECALLFESGFQDTVDKTILVYAPKRIRLQRAMRRDHATQAQILARMAQQMDERQKRRRAGFTIRNDGRTDLNTQIDKLLDDLKS